VHEYLNARIEEIIGLLFREQDWLYL